MKVLVCQTNIKSALSHADIAENVAHTIDQIRFHSTKETQLIILPELSTIDYSRDSFEKLDVISEDLFGPSFQKYSILAKELSAYIVFGIPRKSNNNYFISQIVINSDGNYETHYDKIHIAQFGGSIEKDYFDGGTKLCVFKVEDLKIGLMICYDIRFPLFSALLRRKYDVDVILHPCAFAEDVTFYSWHSFVITRALENLCFFISVNRAGEKWGNSIVCPPWVDGKTKPEIFGKHEQYKEINIDKDHIKKIRKEFPFAEDNFFTSDKGKQNIII